MGGQHQDKQPVTGKTRDDSSASHKWYDTSLCNAKQERGGLCSRVANAMTVVPYQLPVAAGCLVCPYCILTRRLAWPPPPVREWARVPVVLQQWIGHCLWCHQGPWRPLCIAAPCPAPPAVADHCRAAGWVSTTVKNQLLKRTAQEGRVAAVSRG